MSAEIPPIESWWAMQPIDSLYWHSSSGEEYLYVSDAHWVVLNEKIGPFRLRRVCKVIADFKINPREMDDWLYQELIRRGISALFGESP